MMKRLRALLSADNVLETRTKVVRTLQSEERRLGKLIADYVEAERGLVAEAARVALGEQADSSEAIRKVQEAQTAIDGQAKKLSGLRQRLASQAPELEAQRAAVKSALPAHVESIRSGFATKWAQGVAAFNALQGERIAVESRVGKMALPNPAPAAFELAPELTAPWETVEQLTGALNELAGWDNARLWPLLDSRGVGPHHAYSDSAVYVIASPNAGAEVGSFVMGASFAPGVLSHLVQIGYAVPLSETDWAASLEAGSRASQRVAIEERDSTENANSAADAQHLGSYDIGAAHEAAEFNRKPVVGVKPENVGRVS
jgi:hypothetical protein